HRTAHRMQLLCPPFNLWPKRGHRLSNPPRGASLPVSTPCLSSPRRKRMHPVISIRCPGCNARIKAPFQLIGQERNCPGCGQTLLIQMRAPEDAGPLLLDAPGAAPDRQMNGVKGEEKVILLVDDDRELTD